MEENKKVVVIPKEKAVFWLDKEGYWNNEHGKFQHKKIIDYFHSCIQKDEGGYYLYQDNGDYAEKVYFPYEDTALFVFDVLRNGEVVLVLNTKRKVKLDPQKLFIKDDCLYMRMGDEVVKFAEPGLVKIASLLEEENARTYIRLEGRRFEIPVLASSSADK